jgi:hypothetical protein
VVQSAILQSFVIENMAIWQIATKQQFHLLVCSNFALLLCWQKQRILFLWFGFGALVSGSAINFL